MGGIQRRLLKTVLAVVKHPRLTLLFSSVALAACVVYALARLGISTDQDKLFSPNTPFFHNYLEFERKFPENDAMYAVIEPIDEAHPPALARWTELADGITNRLRGLKKYVKSAECRVSPAELGSQAILLEDPARLQEDFTNAKENLAQLAGIWGQTPSVTTFMGSTPMERFFNGVGHHTSDAQAVAFAETLADSWVHTVRPIPGIGVATWVPDLAKLDASDPRDLGYDYVADESDPAHKNHILLVQIHTIDDDDSSMSVGGEQLDAVSGAAKNVARAFPEFRVGITGRPALDADEMRTTNTDSTHAEIVALIVVFIGMALTLRSIWLAVAAEIALIFGIGWTFGWATASVHELNLLSIVFLITLIGIGMDYLIQILTRYRREARRYIRPAAVWSRVFRYVSPPIFTACLGAAGAFLVSIFTDFRGAAELGIVAGGGLLLCLLAGYTVLPALLVIFPAKLSPVDPDARYAAPRPPASPLRRLLPPALWLMGLSITAPYIPQAHFNPNLLDMQAKNLESVKLVRKLQTWSAVVMSPDLNLLRKVRDAVSSSPTVAETESVLSAQDNYAWLQRHQGELPKMHWSPPAPITPKDLPSIAASAAALAAKLDDRSPKTPPASRDAAAALRTLAGLLNVSGAPAEQAAARLSEWQPLFVDELRGLLGQFSPAPLDVAKLPDELRNHLISADGYYALYIQPKENLWKRQPMADFVGDIDHRVERIANHPPVTGIAPQVFHSTRAIEKSFRNATTYALILVLVLVFLDLRSIGQTLVTVSVLAMGLPMLVGLMGIFNINWNFANFFGLPILIGAGHEYGVFMMHRYREVMHNPRRVWGRWDVSDRALLLCAFVTSSSFGFFWWLADHEGLKSLGLVMAMGTACIYLAAVLVVRPLLKWKIERNISMIPKTIRHELQGSI